MAFNSFRALVALRVLLLVAAIGLAVWGWLIADWLVTPIVSGVVALLLAVELIWYVERGQRELAAFLEFHAAPGFLHAAGCPEPRPRLR